MNRILISLIFCSGCCCAAQAQTANDTIRLNLEQVVEMAKTSSIASKQALTTRKTKYWVYRTYRSNYQPQLALNGILPGYNKTFAEVQQPDGTILFQSIHNNNSSLNLSFSQSIAATGGTVFGTTQLQRFDDFDRRYTLYNNVPFGVGYSQPLFQFNQLKWDRRIEPLKYKESTQAYIEAMENVAITACGYFFDLLLAQVNLQIAETNLRNTKNILRIANEKYALGKISRNMICFPLSPTMRAAWTNSRSRSERTSASTILAVSIQLVTAMMTVIMTGLGRSVAASANTRKIEV